MNVQQKKTPSGESLFSSDPDVMGGRLVFRGTRIPVEVLFENLADGMSLDEILDAYSCCVTNFCANFVGNCAHMQDIAAAEPGRLRKPLCDGGSRSSWGRDVAAAAAAPRGR